MATHAVIKYNLDPFWDDEFKSLDYQMEPFNDPVSVDRWIKQGYQPKFVGDLCDMRKPQPSWNNQIVNHFAKLGWQDIGTSYYKMTSGTVLPTHQDTYIKYIKLFNLQGREHTIRRALVFLEDWKPGHYLEAMGSPYVEWKAGQVVEWVYDTPHLSANVGLEDRYTLQVTGHVND